MTEAALTDPDPIVLDQELRALRAEQHSGAWDYKGDPKDEKAVEAHDTFVASRVKRGIEITAVLRRTNTGPAKPTGARGKRKSKTSEPIDEAAIEAELLG